MFETINTKLDKFRVSTAMGLTFAAIALITPVNELKAQALEEIVVTAQRRQESLQEVPISIEVISGDKIDLQGYRNLEDMGRFSPSVTIIDGAAEQTTTIRGFGTAGNTQLLQAAVPFFLDGIHFGTLSMVKTAFLDTEQIEILKGPQPLHFGMNATAGAFNLTSRRPTREWGGDVSVELANDGKREVTAAFGGPLTDTLAFRVAALSEKGDGPVKSYLDGAKFPKYDNLGGRISLLWNPSEKLEVFSKFEMSRLRQGADMILGCLTEGKLTGFPDVSPIRGSFTSAGAAGPSVDGVDLGNNSSIMAPAPKGVTGGSALLVNTPRLASGQDCFNDGWGINRDGPFIAAPGNVTSALTYNIFDRSIDIRQMTQAYTSVENPDGRGINGLDAGGIMGGEHVDSWNALIDLTYELDNGITINSQTGAVDFLQGNVRNNVQNPIFSNFQSRETDMHQYSQQVRVESPEEGYDLDVAMPGGVNLGFMGGGFYQFHEKDMYSGTIISNLDRGQRLNFLWEEMNTWSAFWGLTFNFMDNQLALEVGGRYTDIKTNPYIRGFGAQHIFDQTPCDSAGNDANPDTCTPDPHFKRVHNDLTTVTYVDPVTGRGGINNVAGQLVRRPADLVRVDSPRIFLAGANLNNLWTPVGFLNQLRGADEAVPLNWRSPGGVRSVGFTAPVYQNQNGPYGPEECDYCIGSIDQHVNGYDTQITVRYTPDSLDRDHTFYFKFAEAFKGPFADTGQSTIPATVEDILFDPEYSTAYEVGAKGMLLDSRLRYDVALFLNEFTDMQTSVAVPPLTTGPDVNLALNAGAQEVKGAEFSLSAAATDYLVLNFGGALMNGELKELDGGGCTTDEQIAASIHALTPVAQGGSFENRTAAERTLATTTLNNLGAERRASLPAASALPEEFFVNGGCRLQPSANGFGQATIDRTGYDPAYTPDYKFVLGAIYTRPVMDSFEAFLNVQGYIEAAKIIDPEGYTRQFMYNDGHGDVNISLGFGPQNANWRVIGFVRSIFEDRPSYNPEYDLERKGIFTTSGQESGGIDGAIGESAFRSYGIRFEYMFQ